MVKTFTVGFGTNEETTIDEVGGKAIGLIRMTKAGVNVPPAVIVPTTYCMKAIAKEVSPIEISSTVYTQLEEIEKMFGYMPLFSVRSGAKISLPGMLDTILNVGLCTATIPAWEQRIGERATWDSYRRLIQMFGGVVFNVSSDKYEAVLHQAKVSEAVTSDALLSVAALKVVAAKFLEITPDFPQSFKMQLRKAITAVFASWNNERAITYRNINKVSHDIGTAVIAQAMVFGNLNDKSATGVLFTRNPSTGENKIHGEFLVNAQGEDVVAGIRTPLSLDEMESWNPTVLAELVDTVNKLEASARDMQDVEFTIQDGKLFVLQTRNAKRTAIAAVKVATDLVVEGVIEKAEAFKRISYEQFITAQREIIDPAFDVKPHGVGIPASSGFATGVVVFSSAKAVELAKTTPVILLAKETTPDDIAGMNAAVGIFTQTGGSSSHAAVVARGMDKVCVVGCLDLTPKVIGVDGSVQAWELGGASITEGVTSITIEGTTGKVWVNVEVPVIGAVNNPAVALLNAWVNEVATYTEKVTGGASGYLLTHQFDTDLDALKSAVTGFTGIVSLSTGKDTIQPWDTYLFELVKPFDDAKIKLDKLTALATIPASNVSIDLDNTVLPNMLKTKLEKNGYSIIPTVSDLEGVVLSSGVVKFAPTFTFTAAVTAVLAMKKQVGQFVKSLVFIDSFDSTKDYSNVHVVASKESVLKSLLA